MVRSFLRVNKILIKKLPNSKLNLQNITLVWYLLVVFEWQTIAQLQSIGPTKYSDLNYSILFFSDKMNVLMSLCLHGKSKDVMASSWNVNTELKYSLKAPDVLWSLAYGLRLSCLEVLIEFSVTQAQKSTREWKNWKHIQSKVSCYVDKKSKQK